MINTLAKPARVVDILGDLTLHMMNQFFSMITFYTNLVFSGRTPFEFMQPLLENHVENIQKIRGSDRAKVYQERVKQLGSYTANLQNLKGASLVETAQLFLSKLCAEQKHLFEEAEKEIAKRIHQVSYQGLSNDLQKLEFNERRW